MEIVFFSGSDFTLSILDSIIDNSSSPLNEIARSQFEELDLANNNPFKDKLDQLLRSCQGLDFANQPVSLKAVVTTSDYTLRGKTHSNGLTKLAISKAIVLFQPEKVKSQWENWSSDNLSGQEIAVVASYGKILSQQILDSFKYGCLNWHPSKLPLYRGMSPMQCSLLNGDSETALSWIEMTEGMDAGNLLLQIDKPLSGHETIAELTAQMVAIGANSWAIAVLCEAYSKHTSDKQFQIPQDLDGVSFTGKITKQLGHIDPFKLTAKDIYNHYRAYFNWPKTSFFSPFFNQQISLSHCQDYVLELPRGLVVFQDQQWLQVLENKKLRTFLKAKPGFVEVSKIKLASGKELNFQGFYFQAQALV
jgi:methionyl-tRNA formyltransferase